jgi:iron complex transport system ATP-binding protein
MLSLGYFERGEESSAGATARLTRFIVSEQILRLDGLTVRRGRQIILDSVDWRVRRGEHWVILGANGSGKTSLLCALTGYLTPSAGRVEVLDAVYGHADWRELRRRIGLVSSSIRQLIPEEDTALAVVLGGREAIIGAWRESTPKARAAARAALRQTECSQLADRPWAVLSQGERQRVLIARALVARPAVLLLDEPCAGMDPVAREKFLAFVERLASAKRSGVTLVWITHHVEEITPSFGFALLLKSGRVLAAGRKNQVLTSGMLTDAFGLPLRLRKLAGRFDLRPRPM